MTPIAETLARGAVRLEEVTILFQGANTTGLRPPGFRQSCAVNSMMRDENREEAVAFLGHVIGVAPDLYEDADEETWYNVIEWNDDPGRTKEEVVAAMFRAAGLALVEGV